MAFKTSVGAGTFRDVDLSSPLGKLVVTIESLTRPSDLLVPPLGHLLVHGIRWQIPHHQRVRTRAQRIPGAREELAPLRVALPLHAAWHLLPLLIILLDWNTGGAWRTTRQRGLVPRRRRPRESAGLLQRLAGVAWQQLGVVRHQVPLPRVPGRHLRRGAWRERRCWPRPWTRPCQREDPIVRPVRVLGHARHHLVAGRGGQAVQHAPDLGAATGLDPQQRLAPPGLQPVLERAHANGDLAQRLLGRGQGLLQRRSPLPLPIGLRTPLRGQAVRRGELVGHVVGQPRALVLLIEVPCGLDGDRGEEASLDRLGQARPGRVECQHRHAQRLQLLLEARREGQRRLAAAWRPAGPLPDRVEVPFRALFHAGVQRQQHDAGALVLPHARPDAHAAEGGDLGFVRRLSRGVARRHVDQHVAGLRGRALPRHRHARNRRDALAVPLCTRARRARGRCARVGAAENAPGRNRQLVSEGVGDGAHAQ
mmetsp:Transcript_100730/g.307956  ORF Transcript_100730/g.307956 Transcript_100730/m.307956 type:complete len:480 (-) Transcript_100730:531-1970(-)